MNEIARISVHSHQGVSAALICPTFFRQISAIPIEAYALWNRTDLPPPPCARPISLMLPPDWAHRNQYNIYEPCISALKYQP